MALLNFAITIATVTGATLLAVRVLVVRRGQPNAWLVAAICLGVVCNQVLSWQEYAVFEPFTERFNTGDWAPILNLVRNTAPGLFMIQAHRMFEEGQPFPRWLLVAFALQLGLELIAFVQPLRGVLSPAPAALELMFGGLALYWTLARWPADLVEVRRKARAITLVLVAANMIAPSLLLRLVVMPGAWSFYTYTLLSSLTLMVITSILVLEGDKGSEPFGTPSHPFAIAPTTQGPPQGSAALQGLRHLLDVERVYLEPDLKLSTLARRANIPEYRLRRLIHDELGFRNFNVFLHHFRIEEACQRLRDPKERRAPILTIALSVGYGSVNSFNRGFRAMKGCSPSDYRDGASLISQASDREISHQILQSADT